MNSQLTQQIREAAERYAATINPDGSILDSVRYNSRIEGFEAGASYMDSLSKWIRVEDGLPKEGGRYLCYLTELNDLGFVHYQWNCSYNPNDKTWGGTDDNKVTHWMELPESPVT